MHRIEILTAVITNGKCIVPIHNNYGSISSVSPGKRSKHENTTLTMFNRLCGSITRNGSSVPDIFTTSVRSIRKNRWPLRRYVLTANDQNAVRSIHQVSCKNPPIINAD